MTHPTRNGARNTRTKRSPSTGSAARDSLVSRIGQWIRAVLAERPNLSLPGDYIEPGVRRRWLGYFLPAAFIFFWVLVFYVGFNWQTVGLDARIYYEGSAAWLSGKDPWATGALLNGRLFSYAGLPPTVVLLAPLALLPEEAVVWLLLPLSVLAAVGVVRALRLPPIWIAYPPLLAGVLSANPHVLVLALVVAAGTWGNALAAVLKIVVIPPLIGERRWLALLVAGVVFGATVVALPGLWSSFLNQAGRVQDTISTESGGTFSAWGKPLPFIATVLSLCVLARLDFRAAAWLVVPALFPTSQYYYAMFALPVDPFLAAAMAFPFPLVPPLLTIAYTAVRLGVAIHSRRFGTTLRTRSAWVRQRLGS